MTDTILQTEIRRGVYCDSIVLMQLQVALAAQPGVAEAGAVMGTAANLDLLRQSGLYDPTLAGAGDSDLVLALRAESDDDATSALAQVDDLMARRSQTSSDTYQPHTLAAAIEQLPEASWVAISVPGRFAAGVAGQALELGRHVFMFSDNVRLEDEIKLKRQAGERGLMMMGPDCGTAIVGGVGLGFANRVRRGAVGLVAASGTGLQTVASRLHALGSGVSQALGTGGRDLGTAVGGASTLQAIDLLARDPATEVLVLISKPPAPAIARKVLAAAEATGKPVVAAFVGASWPLHQIGRIHFARNLSTAAQLAHQLGHTDETTTSDARNTALAGKRRYLRGLFAGGTLAYEAVASLQALLDPLYTNVRLGHARELKTPHRSQAHTLIDLGADEYTSGRLHPMIDPQLRLERLRREAADPKVAVLLLDLVLGDSGHPDPAAELADEVRRITAADGPVVVAIVVGTDLDPQGASHQIDQLTTAGAQVFDDPAAGFARVAELLIEPTATPPDQPLALSALAPPVVLNVGLETLHNGLTAQEAGVLQLDWRPPAGGNERLMAILRRLQD